MLPAMDMARVHVDLPETPQEHARDAGLASESRQMAACRDPATTADRVTGAVLIVLVLVIMAILWCHGG